MRKIDRVILCFMLFIVTLAWCFYFIKSTPLAILLTLTFFIIEYIIIKLVSKKKGGASYAKFNQHLAMRGHAYTLELLVKAINSNLSPKIENDAIIITKDGRKELVFACVKFSQSGAEDIAKAIRLALKLDVNFVHFVASGVDRRALNIINSEHIRFNFITTKPFLQRLEKLLLVPEFNYKKNSAKSFKTIIAIALNKKNAPRLLLVGVVLLVLSFITPLSGYYLVMASVCVTLATICMFNNVGDNSGGNLFGKE